MTKAAGMIGSGSGLPMMGFPVGSSLDGMKEPVLISSSGGVGIKRKLAFLLEKHDTVGIDCVAMCVNDIVCRGARPLFFLDYVACGKNIPERIAQIVSGVVEGCARAGCAFIGGETTEHPGLMPEEEYDLAGFTVGVADREKMPDSAAVREGDVILALPSNGVHTGGFPLLSRVPDLESVELLSPCPELDGESLGEALLTPSKIYTGPMLRLMEQVPVKGAAHITGGFYESIPRCLPAGLSAKIERANLRVLPIFDLIARRGGIGEREMFGGFNMGVGMCVVVSAREADRAVASLRKSGEKAYIIGEVVRDNGGMILC